MASRLPTLDVPRSSQLVVFVPHLPPSPLHASWALRFAFWFRMTALFLGCSYEGKALSHLEGFRVI